MIEPYNHVPWVVVSNIFQSKKNEVAINTIIFIQQTSHDQVDVVCWRRDQIPYINGGRDRFRSNKQAFIKRTDDVYIYLALTDRSL